MKIFRALFITVLWACASSAFAQEVIVTRSFTGLWTQTQHESQGINLQIIEQQDGTKVAVAYWFTYGDDDASAWFYAIGTVTGATVDDMVLYQADDIGFLEPNQPGNDRVLPVGTMTLEFTSCVDGTVSFSTPADVTGSGSFPIERFTRLYESDCSGGLSDDMPANVLPSEQRISLVPARNGISGSGHADWEQRADRTEFSVEAEDITDGTYRIMVGGVDRGALVVSLGIGETEFRSPVEDGKVLLTFDPRSESIEVHDNQGAVLTSDGATFGDPTNQPPPNLDFGTVDLEVELDNSGVQPLASGDARLEPREDRTDFQIEIEDVTAGSYPLFVGGIQVGIIEAVTTADGVKGELEFRNPVEPGKVLLDFDPRGQLIEVKSGAQVILSANFPDS